LFEVPGCTEDIKQLLPAGYVLEEHDIYCMANVMFAQESQEADSCNKSQRKRKRENLHDCVIDTTTS